ncbi:sulfur carrier protein ThiS adenylyltransferase ThiF [candidate division TA06 bacterium]|uniref:Sulfur carrier protein ThiS adenylyltransferase ThiF n=1 Tax=candidate division TA06 bacterium TaxID=2250710 RepID=A0A933MKJ0_UNCT6|nr:sulfur carrier protein ThiS adenylyltransferase ThiF [candidate division TA06 bacterium]
MKIYLNEKHIKAEKGAKVAELVKQHKPGADVYVLNGFPCLLGQTVSEGDHLVLIKKGEVPSKNDLEHLLSARHTPGIADTLKKSCVGLAGCGGLGSTAAIALARAGVGRMVIADQDVVEPSNLNRQQYFVYQIGLPKVEAIKEVIKKANPFIKVETHHLRIVPENVVTLFGKCDAIIEAFDMADQKQMLVETALSKLLKTPIVVGSGMAGYGANNILRTRKTGMLYLCGDEQSEAGPGFGLMAPRVGLAACMQANQVLEILLGPDPRIKQSES